MTSLSFRDIIELDVLPSSWKKPLSSLRTTSLKVRTETISSRPIASIAATGGAASLKPLDEPNARELTFTTAQKVSLEMIIE